MCAEGKQIVCGAPVCPAHFSAAGGKIGILYQNAKINDSTGKSHELTGGRRSQLFQEECRTGPWATGRFRSCFSIKKAERVPRFIVAQLRIPPLSPRLYRIQEVSVFLLPGDTTEVTTQNQDENCLYNH